MRRMIAILFAVVLLSIVSPVASEQGVTIVTPQLGSRMTPEELAWMDEQVRQSFPRSLDRVVAFIGTEKARKIFKKFHVLIRDIKSEDPHLMGASPFYGLKRRGAVSPYRSPYARGRQSITIFAQPFLTGVADVETVLTHEMLHVAFEVKYSFEELKKMPDYVQEGICYYGEGDLEEVVVGSLNSGKPMFDAQKIMESDGYDRFRELTFLYCFEKQYRLDARKELLLKLFKGKPYKKAYESTATEDWKKIKTKCDDCLKNYLEEKITKGGPYQQVREALEAKEYEKTLDLGQNLLQTHPDTIWRVNANWDMALALERLKRYDEAIERYERIRTGKVGQSARYPRAAYRIVQSLLKSKRCEQARVKRAEFARLYPQFWKSWREKLDKAFEKRCGQAP